VNPTKHDSTPFVIDLANRIASWFGRRRVALTSSAHHPHLEVSWVRGRKILDGATVNYSFGGLHDVFDEAFERLDVSRRPIRSVLVLGLGVGSVVHLLRRDHGVRAPITAVELDPVMVDVARRHFDLDRWSNLEVVIDDAVAWARASRARFDLVVVDLFLEAHIPAPCRSPDFLRALRDRVAPGGLLLYNVVASRPEQRESASEIAGAFESALRGSRVLGVRGNRILTWERPRADSVVVDAEERRYSPAEDEQRR